MQKKKTVKKTLPFRKPVKKTAASKNTRPRINTRALIKALQEHVLGESEMTASQVSAALSLLKLSGQEDSASAGLPMHEEALRMLEADV
jgi:hypothetical protein